MIKKKSKSKPKTTARPQAKVHRRDASCSAAFEKLATSLHRMGIFYANHPSPGLIRPIDAILMVMGDIAGAVGKAAEGKTWDAPGVWR